MTTRGLPTLFAVTAPPRLKLKSEKQVLFTTARFNLKQAFAPAGRLILPKIAASGLNRIRR
jgi:hypothetical protein